MAKKREAVRRKIDEDIDDQEDEFQNSETEGVIRYSAGDFSAFEPKGRDLTKMYPELLEMECFNQMSINETMFCWLVASKSSPIVITNKDRKKRVEQAMSSAFFSSASYVKKYGEAFVKGDFPEKILQGIEFFQNVDVGTRLRAAFMVREAIRRIEITIHGVSMERLSMMDGESMKAYMTNMRSSIEFLPNLIKMSESNFSVSSKGKKKKDESSEMPTLAQLEDEDDTNN